MFLNDYRFEKRRTFEQFQDTIARLYPETTTGDYENYTGGRVNILTRTVTFQVTDNCNLACKYCYQINKGKRRMSFEVAKTFIDLLLSGEKGFKEYISLDNSPGLIVEFIGGEPFMEVELIDQIVTYLRREMIRLRHPWLTKFCLSICSNGVLYNTPAVQKFLNKYRSLLSLSITIDGNKELHDSCRVFHNGDPSYDIAVAAAKDWMSRGNYMGSKITIAPENITYLYDAIVHMIELGYEDINANCVYEKGWELHHATEFYHQMKRIADFMVDNNLVENISLALFNEQYFNPKPETDLVNWCGGNASMLACDPDGKLFPCIRYMESSLGTEQDPIVIGDLQEGIAQSAKCKNCIHTLSNIDRRTQSTDECFNCPIANGCSWCTAYNYQVFGTPDKRATYICEMHKARALANVYFWNKFYIKSGSNAVFTNHCPDEWALRIISAEELAELKSLTERSNVNENNLSQ